MYIRRLESTCLDKAQYLILISLFSSILKSPVFYILSPSVILSLFIFFSFLPSLSFPSSSPTPLPSIPPHISLSYLLSSLPSYFPHFLLFPPISPSLQVHLHPFLLFITKSPFFHTSLFPPFFPFSFPSLSSLFPFPQVHPSPLPSHPQQACLTRMGRRERGGSGEGGGVGTGAETPHYLQITRPDYQWPLLHLE